MVPVMRLIEGLKANKQARVVLNSARTLRDQFGCNLGLFRGLSALARFYREYGRMAKATEPNPHFSMTADLVLPCLRDRTEDTPVEPVYFVQDAWFARRISGVRPPAHVDVGSSAKTMALIAQFIPVTMVDIRPVTVSVKGFSFRKGSILDLPFESGTVNSLSSLCVVEHIGLGRYGDEADNWGSEKALAELIRVLAPGGDLYLTLPIDSECRVYFNAHRAFTRDYVIALCADLTLVNESYLYGLQTVDAYDKLAGFGTGMFHFRKP
jgi:SAM-dependent methyltransferase